MLLTLSTTHAPATDLGYCRDEAAARRRFGVVSGGAGICTTRTGRRFFDDPDLEAAVLERVRTAATAAGFWDTFGMDCAGRTRRDVCWRRRTGWWTWPTRRARRTASAGGKT
jgi:hypothetical protein